MGWIENLQGEVVGMDTTPLIYLIAKNPLYLVGWIPFALSSLRWTEASSGWLPLQIVPI
jgi:hypothetical protein